MIYLARAGDRVKIGYAEDVPSRIKTLQTACPLPLTLLAAFPGDRRAETALHRRYAHLRLIGEWFSAAPELLAAADIPPTVTTTPPQTTTTPHFITSSLLQETFSMTLPSRTSNQPPPPTTNQPQPATPLAFTDLAPTGSPPLRLSASFRTIDAVLGGGFTVGSTILLSGDPGAGKSTLMLQVAAYAACRGYSAVYATAEEDPSQVQLRAARLGLARAPARLASTDDVAALIAALDSPATAPAILVVDSLQRFRDPAAAPSLPGSPNQTRAVLAALLAHAHRRHTTTIVISHVNKQNRASGTNDLQHDVDVLLHLSALGDRRTLRAIKNRHGPTDRTAVLRMTPEGVRE